ncbi:MTP protein, partial [Atractosteus spatula]|nr:MTP protein [Atractosteus spatula]
MEAVVQLRSLWTNPNNEQEQFVEIKFQDLKVINNVTRNESQSFFKDSLAEDLLGHPHLTDLRKPLLLHYVSGNLEKLFAAKEGNVAIMNLKRGLASLFQMWPHSGTRVENDVTGRCDVLYEVSGKEITKLKDFQSCKKDDFGYTSTNQVFGTSMRGSSKCVYSLESHLIQAMECEESHEIRLNLQSTVGTKINSRQWLLLLSTNPGESEFTQPGLQEVLKAFEELYIPITIHADPVEKKTCTSCHLVTEQLTTLKTKEVDVSKILTTKKFLKVVRLLRQMKKENIFQLLRTADHTVISFLIDAATAALTPESLEALSSFLDSTNRYQGVLLQRFLHACAFSPRPSKGLLNMLTRILSSKIPQKEVQETAIITLGSVIGKMCSAKMCESQEVVFAKNLILDGLKSSTEDSKMMTYLLALKSARLPETIPILLQYTEMSGAVSSIALSALQRLPVEHIDSKVKDRMRQIFNHGNQHFTETVRLAAAEILLNNEPLHMDIRNIIEAIGKEGPEVSRYLASKIQSIQYSDHAARKIINDVLKDLKLNNYNHLSRRGGSTVYSGYMAATKDVMSSYTFDFLFSDYGFLRQSNTNFYTHINGSTMHSVQVSMEAKGLDSLFGNEGAEEDEEIEAEMSAIVLDVQLRPVMIFQGYSDLMEKYWSATGEPENILSTNILIIDHLQALSLQSGLQALIHIQGGLTLDVTGSIEISLLSQQSKSTVRSRGVLAVYAWTEIDTSFRQAGIQTNSEGHAPLTFVNTVSLSQLPISHCLQLKKDSFHYRKSIVIHERFPSGKKFMMQKGRKFTRPGEETSLHQRNSEVCKKLLED